MDERALIGLLGLAMRAGKLHIGTGRTVDAVRGNADVLVLMDGAVSDNTRKRLTDACTTHEKALRALPPGLLENAVGRAGTMVAAVAAGGLRQKITSMVEAG